MILLYFENLAKQAGNKVNFFSNVDRKVQKLTTRI